MSKRIVRFRCPYCSKTFEREPLIQHVADEHDDMIPEGYSALRVVFDSINKYPIGYNGKCTECGGPTGWDEKKGRYNRQCGKKSCHESYLRKFETNMNNKTGVTRISSTPEGQEKMLANRRISGTYKFQNGVTKTYTGSYELKALEFMDKVMNINPDDLMCPGPVLYYPYEGKNHIYITDFYYIPYNLVIEVKDGGKNPNKRDMPEYRAKQVAKEEYLIKNTNYNYLRLTDNDLSQLLTVFMDLKLQLVENTGERVIHVNEAMNALTSGYIPGFNANGSVVVVNYMQNNVFSGEQESGIGFSDSIKLDSIFMRDKEGVLRKAPREFLERCNYNVYLIPKEKTHLDRLQLNEFCTEEELQEALFGQRIYVYDQIQFLENVYPVIDFYKSLDLLKEATMNYFRNQKRIVFKESDATVKDLLSGEKFIESSRIPELYLKDDGTNIPGLFLECLSLKEEE